MATYKVVYRQIHDWTGYVEANDVQSVVNKLIYPIVTLADGSKTTGNAAYNTDWEMVTDQVSGSIISLATISGEAVSSIPDAVAPSDPSEE